MVFMFLTAALIFALIAWRPGTTERWKHESSIAITLPDNVTLRAAIQLLAQQRQALARFDSTCTTELLNRGLRGGSLSGSDAGKVMESLIHRLVDRPPSVRLHAEFKREEGIYDIRCST